MDQIEFLNLTTQPAIWDAEQTGWFLNMSREDVLLLCRRNPVQFVSPAKLPRTHPKRFPPGAAMK
jgi:hypothetical protein